MRVFIQSATSGGDINTAMRKFNSEWSEKSALFLSVFLCAYADICNESTVVYDDYLLGQILLCPSVISGEETVYMYCEICCQHISPELSLDQSLKGVIPEFGCHGRGIIAHHFSHPFGQTNIATPDEVRKAEEYMIANGYNAQIPLCKDTKKEEFMRFYGN